MPKTTRLFGILTGVLAIGLALAACSSPGTPPVTPTGSVTPTGNTEAPIKIAVVISTSGVYAGLGQPEVDALKAYEANQPADARQIQFVFENPQSDPAQGAAIAKRLVADKSIVGLIAGATHAVANGMFPIVQPAKIPWIVITPVEYPNYNKEPFIFGPNLGPLVNHGEMHAQMLSLLGIKLDNVTVLVNDDASGQATHSAFAQFPNFVDAPATLTDYAPVMAEIKASDRKAIVNNQSGANAGYARKAEIAAGLDIPFLAGPQVLTSSFANIVGSDAAGVDVLALRPMLSEQPPGTDPKQAAAIAAYRDAFQSYTNRDPSLESAGPINVWDAALSFGYAAAGLKDVTRDSLQKQMIGQEYMGAGGYVKRTAADHNGFQQDSWVYASLTKDGKVKAVAEMRDGKPTLVK